MSPKYVRFFLFDCFPCFGLFPVKNIHGLPFDFVYGYGVHNSYQLATKSIPFGIHFQVTVCPLVDIL